jgi:tRNA dimethylallyltransferase
LTTPTLIVICGPTAIGKTKFAIDLANEFGTEIISADSRQFFKELSIGTAKPNPSELKAAPHHFVNNKSIVEEYNASDFEYEVLEFLNQFYKNKSTAIMCGGSGMYINAVCNGFDNEVPTADNKIREKLNNTLKKEGIESLQNQLKTLDPSFYAQVDLKNSNRLIRAIEVCLITGKPYSEIRKGIKKDRPFQIIKIGLELDRSKLYNRINQRVDIMMKEGLLNEIKSVEKFKEKNALKTVGYKELFNYLNGECSLEYAIEKIKTNSRRYAKRQMTWFKKDTEISWFKPSQKSEVIAYIRKRTKNGK